MFTLNCQSQSCIINANSTNQETNIMTEWEKAETGVFYMPFEDPKLVEGLKRSQQMFADLNKHAVKPSKSLSRKA